MDVVVPEAHRITAEAKLAWLKVQTDARDAVQAVEKIPSEIKAEANKLVGIYVVMALHILTTFVLFYLRHL